MEHNAPLIWQVNCTIFVGGTLVFPPDNSPDSFLELIEKERITHTLFVPTMVIGMLNSPKLTEVDFSLLEVMVVGASKLNPEVAKKIPPTFKCKLQNALGMAEGFCCCTKLDDSDEVVFNTVGKPFAPGDEFKIVDEEDNEVPPGEIGELLVRGPYTLRGYYKAGEHNAKVFTSDGFYRTGDIVRLDAQDNIIIEGRSKDLINRGGEKISAEEVENLILAHPKVRNVAAIAMPDEVYGEKVCLFVQLKSKDLGITLEGLREFMLEKKVSKFKLPERLEIIEEFPMTGVGKISKKVLREDIKNKLEQEKILGKRAN